jgi:hypothetical protein
MAPKKVNQDTPGTTNAADGLAQLRPLNRPAAVAAQRMDKITVMLEKKNVEVKK